MQILEFYSYTFLFFFSLYYYGKTQSWNYDRPWLRRHYRRRNKLGRLGLSFCSLLLLKISSSNCELGSNSSVPVRYCLMCLSRRLFALFFGYVLLCLFGRFFRLVLFFVCALFILFSIGSNTALFFGVRFRLFLFGRERHNCKCAFHL